MTQGPCEGGGSLLGTVIDEYVKYGMGVFEYEHERQQVLVQQKEDVVLEMQEGV